MAKVQLFAYGFWEDTDHVRWCFSFPHRLESFWGVTICIYGWGEKYNVDWYDWGDGKMLYHAINVVVRIWSTKQHIAFIWGQCSHRCLCHRIAVCVVAIPDPKRTPCTCTGIHCHCVEGLGPTGIRGWDTAYHRTAKKVANLQICAPRSLIQQQDS